MNCCRETAKMGVPPGNRPAAPRDWFRGVPERYVAGVDTRGRQEGHPYPWSQQVIHEISGLRFLIIMDSSFYPVLKGLSARVIVKRSCSEWVYSSFAKYFLPKTIADL